MRYDKKELLCITKSIRIKLTSLFSDANKSLFEQALQMKIINITNNTDIQSAVKIKTVLSLSVLKEQKMNVWFKTATKYSKNRYV